MKKKVATIILNRNLPKVTDKLYNQIKKYNKNETDIFIVDAGSIKKNISKYSTWIADWKQAKKKGLRFGRGMNFGLSKLYEENRFYDYEYFFLITNDTIIKNKPIIKDFCKIMEKHNYLAILSPCSKKWGEENLLQKNKIKYFWYIHNNAYFLRRSFLDKIKNIKKPGYRNFLFDGKNFRGYGIVSEIILKAYKLNMAAAITSKIWVEENENYLLKMSNLIKTEPYNQNLILYLREGITWMKKKYKFQSKWDFSMHIKKFYDKFFQKNKELLKYKL